MNFIVQLLVWFGIECEVKRGTKRVAVIFPEYGFALKFAIFQPYYFFKLLWRFRKRIDLFKTCMYKTSGRIVLLPGNLIGFIENWREYQFFQNNRMQPFLLPVDFSFFGICNIMPIKNDLPQEIDLYTLFREFDLEEDGHHFKNQENFCFFAGHLCMCDYGSAKTQEIIRNHHFFPSLTEVFIRERFPSDL